MSTPEPPENDVSSGFPFELQYASILGSQMAYVDTRPNQFNRSTPTALFIHGNPTSSYIWRNIIPYMSPLMRCVALDLIGMGHSSKPANLSYRFTDHYTYLSTFISTVIPSGPIILVMQDWGTALGFHWAYQQVEQSAPGPPTRVLGLAFMEFIRPFPIWNDMTPDGSSTHDIFSGFRDRNRGRQMIIDQNIFVEHVLPGGVVRELTETEHEYYKRPYLEPASREPVYVWPNQIPIEQRPSDVYDIATRYHNWLLESDLPKLLFWATPGGLVTPEKATWYLENMTNTKGVDVGAGIHYLQEDHPKRIGADMAAWAQGLIKLTDNP